MQMEPFFKNNFQHICWLADVLHFCCPEHSWEGRQQEGGWLVKPRYDKVCWNYFDHSPYDKTETTYQAKSLLFTVCSCTKA